MAATRRDKTSGFSDSVIGSVILSSRIEAATPRATRADGEANCFDGEQEAIIHLQSPRGTEERAYGHGQLNSPGAAAFRFSVCRVKFGRPVGIRADLPSIALAD